MASKAVDSEQEWGADRTGATPGRASGKRRGLWIGLGLGIAGLLAVTCLGGGLALMFFGLGMVTSEIEDELRTNAVLQAELGTLEEFEMDWPRSLREADEDVFVYRAKGSKGSGIVRVESETGSDDLERILWAELELPSGEKHELVAQENPGQKQE